MITHTDASSIQAIANLQSPSAPRRAHLIGAGGAGMQSLAELMTQAGWRLSASDSNPASASRFADCREHHPGNVSADVQLVVYSDAVADSNSERLAAQRLAIPTLSYPAAVAQWMRAKRGVAVAGTHGKSTVAAMLTEILEAAGAAPTFLFGATRRDGRAGGGLGQGDWMVAEACEYRENFRFLEPEIAVLLTIDPDHFDYYRDTRELEAAFDAFASSVTPGGSLFYHAGCPRACRIASRLAGRCVSFALGMPACWQATPDGAGRFAIRDHGRLRGEIRLRVPGQHNALNALAAAAVADRIGVGWRAIRDGLERFQGLSRRLEIIVNRADLAVIDDFAHLPAEVVAGLATVRHCFAGRRLWCIFEPHQVSRTASLLDEFALSLQNADRIIVADIFRAREGDPQPGEVTAQSLADRVEALGGNVVPVHTNDEIRSRLESDLQAGDVVVTMGAGTIGKIAHGIAERF